MNENNNERDSGQKKLSLKTKIFAILSTILGIIAFFSNVGGAESFFKEHFGAKKEVKVSDNDRKIQSGPDQREKTKKERYELQPVKKVAPSIFLSGLPAKSNEFQEVVFFVSSNQSELDPGDIRTALETSFQIEGYEPIYPFNGNLTQSMITKFVRTKGASLPELVKYYDYEVLTSFKVSYRKASNDREACSISLNLTMKDLSNNRRVLSLNEDFNGNGIDNNAAFQNALKQIERYVFFK